MKDRKEMLILGQPSRRRKGEKEAWLGPLKIPSQPLEIPLRPLTIWVGPQASGKSLLMQLVFFLRALPALAARFLPETYAREDVSHRVLYLLNLLRRGESGEGVRGFYGMVDGSVVIRWKDGQRDLGLTVYGTRSDILRVSEDIHTLLSRPNWRDYWMSQHTDSLFVPTERTVYARLWNVEPGALRGSHMPLTVRWFSAFMQEVREAFPEVERRVRRNPRSPVRWLLDRAESMLRGSAYLPDHGPRLWKWRTRRGGQRVQHDLELASSGQMAGWTLAVLAASLLFWKETGQLRDDRPFYLHIEEPEAHLHPMAQVHMLEILLFLVRHGIWVSLTTHSPLFLYLLNPFLEASDLGEREDRDLPPPELRLAPADVAVYEVREGEVRSIMDEAGWIDEDRLREAEWLADRYFNRIRAVLAREQT